MPTGLERYPEIALVLSGGNALGDGGFAANAPADLVLDTPAAGERLCIIIDLFSERGPRPRSWIEASGRQTDLVYAIQTLRTLRGAEEAERLRAELCAIRGEAEAGRTTVRRIAYRSVGETTMKSFYFARAAILRRWDAGERDMRAALGALA